MIKIVGVRFRNAGKVYYFDPGDLEIGYRDHVIVETARGIEYGDVVGGVRMVPDDQVVQPLRPVIRVADAADDEKAADNRAREKDAIAVCKEKIRHHALEMKLIDAEYTFDGNKLLFYFTADGRVDFRDLVKDLASVFKMRIELRQVGVRDETKLLGGVGICGRPLCCHTWLPDFVPVSIRMAKEQSLSLNPTKISGVCGRLMCCLKNEEDTYEYLNSRLPAVGDEVITANGTRGEVHSVSVLRQRVKILVDVDDEKEIQEYSVEELTFRPRVRHKEKNKKNSGERPSEHSDRKSTGEYSDRKSSGEHSERKPGGERPERKSGTERADRKSAGDYAEQKSAGEYADRKKGTDRDAPKPGDADRKKSADRQERKNQPERTGKHAQGERRSAEEQKKPADRSMTE